MDAIICPECGAKNTVESNVCEQCNTDLTAVKSVMDTANNHYNEALAYAHAGKLEEALAQIEAALALSAQNSEYHNLQGTIYAQKGLYSEAIRAWERCLTLDPEMEKAYKNIEKAQRMESEAAEEQRRRPFLLTSIVTICVAAFLLVTTIYFGAKTYFAGNTINNLQTQLQTKTSDLQEVMTKYKELNERFPEGLSALVTKLDKAQALAEDRQKQVEQLTERRARVAQAHNQQISLLQNQIKTLQEEKNELKDETQKIFGLKAQLQTQQSKQQAMERTLAERNESLKQAHEDVEEITQRLVAKNNELNETRKQKDQVIYDLKQEKTALEEKYRGEINDLRDQIASLTRQVADMKYADKLLAEAIDNMEASNFQLAGENVEEALNRSPENPLALALNQDLTRILSDPVELELRRHEIMMREAQRVEQKNKLVTRFLQKAEDYNNDGAYDKAIELTQRALALNPKPGEKEKGREILNEAKEQNVQITMKLLEAKKEIKEGNTREAKRILDRVLKDSPTNSEARDLRASLDKEE